MSEEETGPTVDERAAQIGWVNEDTWVERGNSAEDHIGAEDFMTKQEENGGLAIKNARRLSDQVHAQEKAIVALEARWQKTYDADTADLKAQIRKAAEEGDMDAYDAHAASLEEREKIEPAVDTSMQVAAQAFVARVPEFNTDATVARVAKGLETDVRSDLSFSGADHATVFAEVEKLLREELPHKFKHKEVTPRKSVEPAGRAVSKGGKVTFKTLPAEDRAQYETTARMFKNGGKEYTKEQFMKTYIESLSDA